MRMRALGKLFKVDMKTSGVASSIIACNSNLYHSKCV